jgi:hypothetical protein
LSVSASQNFVDALYKLDRPSKCASPSKFQRMKYGAHARWHTPLASRRRRDEAQQRRAIFSFDNATCKRKDTTGQVIGTRNSK